MNGKRGILMLITTILLVNTIFAQIREIPKAVEEIFLQQYTGATDIDYRD